MLSKGFSFNSGCRSFNLFVKLKVSYLIEMVVKSALLGSERISLLTSAIILNVYFFVILYLAQVSIVESAHDSTSKV